MKGVEGRFKYLKTRTGIKVSAKKHKKTSRNTYKYIEIQSKTYEIIKKYKEIQRNNIKNIRKH